MPANATGQISTSLQITFTLNEEGTKVSEEITLTNNNDTSTAVSSYNLVLGTAEPEDLTVELEGNGLDFDVKKQAGLTQIVIDLDNEILEADQSLKINLSYIDKSLVYVKGSRLAVAIPKFSADASLNVVALKMLVPKSWGGINYSSLSYTTKESGEFTEITFSEDFKEEKDIFMTFGNSEYYEMTLKYRITNNKQARIVKKITVPNDTSTQSVYWSGINLPPDYSYKDFDGNHVINYILEPGEEENVILKFIIKEQISNEDQIEITPLDEDEVFEYTDSDVFWGTNDPEIVALSKKLITGKRTNLAKSEAILEYVTDKLVYSDEVVLDSTSERRGGLGSLNNPTGVICQSYVDLFVTLARSADIPTRAVSGFAFPDTDRIQELPNGVLHSWVEIWDENLGWVELDPTWEDTSELPYRGNLGLGHLRWVTYGKSSTKPDLPVGYNLIPTQNGLNVTTSITPLRKTEEYNIVASDESNISLINSTNPNLSITVENTGNVVLSQFEASLVGDSSVFNEIQTLRETATEDDENEIILVPTEKQSFNLLLDSDIFNPLTLNQEDSFKVVFSAYYKTKQITEELKSSVQIDGFRLSGLGLYIAVAGIFVIIILVAFAIRRLVYKKTSAEEKVHNISSRF